MKLYHNPQCSKSRAALAHLEAKYPDLQLVKYLENPPTADQLIDMIERSDSPAEDFVRWADARLLGLSLEDKNDPAQIAALIVKQPKVMQRPLVDDGNKVVICRSNELLQQL